MKVAALLSILLSATAVQAVSWNGNNWAFACDFRNGDMGNARTNGENCGGTCASTPGCTHFTWTNFNGGTCWMKSGPVSKNDAFDTGDYGMVCGVMDVPQPPPPGGEVAGPVLTNVKATRHVNYGGDACALPKASYTTDFPFALGDIDSLKHLKFTPDLCGHILRINCGNGPLDIIITNSNLGGGLDLYSRSTWPKATNNKPPGEAFCSVQLTTKNPISGGNNQCFYKPGTKSAYYNNVALFNVNAKIVTGATIGGRRGEHRGPNPYFAFDLGRPVDANEQVTFSFSDGSSYTVRLGDCVDVGSEQLWT